MDKLQDFNASQREAICHERGPALVLAGPGSGKTAVITKRLQYLTQTLRIPPQEILVVTFTKAAAKEMQQRFELLAGERLPIRFGTFHAIFYHILKEHSHIPLTILKEQEKTEYLHRILKRERLEPELAEPLLAWFGRIKNGPLGFPTAFAPGHGTGHADVQGNSGHGAGYADVPGGSGFGAGYASVQGDSWHCTGYADMPGNSGLGAGYADVPDEIGIGAPQAERIFLAYRDLCRERGKLDFDDMAYECLRLFAESPETLRIWQRRCRYVLADEYQDIAPIQERLLFLLAQPENNLFAVGDDDQAIYGFRGAGTESMLSFPRHFLGAKEIFLEMNYRCRPGIIEAACAVISQNKARFPKTQRPARERSMKEEVICRGFPDQESENDNILEILRVLRQEGALSACAVLYRKSADAQPLINLLKGSGIPCGGLQGQKGLSGHFITEDIRAYLRFIAGERTRKNFYRIMNRPERGIDRESCPQETVAWEELLSWHQYDRDVINNIRKLERDCLMAGTMSPYAAMMYVRKGFGYENWLRERYRGAQLEGYLETLLRLQKLAGRAACLKEWEDLLDKGKDGCGEEAEGGGVRILTYHASKGLEFDHVILPDLNEGIVPHRKAESAPQIEEERRMFYVAMTRAKERLYLFYQEGTKEEPETMSRFLKALSD